METIILYEDEDIIVCHKAPGMATQTAQISEKDVVSEIKNHIGAQYIGLVHRLDQPVEGILVMGKTKKAAAILSEQMAKDTVHKKYYALLTSMPKEQNATLVNELVKEQKGNHSHVGKIGEANAKRAELFYEVIEQTGDYPLVRIRLLTGRHHQIRVQMSFMGNPILGDLKYGGEEAKVIANKAGASSIALCAYALEFVHPSTKKIMKFEIHPQGKVFAKCTF